MPLPFPEPCPPAEAATPAPGAAAGPETPAPPAASRRWTLFGLQARLREIVGKPLVLVITDNVGTMVSVKRGPCPTLRAHRMFLDAPDPVVEVMGRWLAGRPFGRDLVQEYINANRALIRARPAAPRRRRIHTEGRFHDLAALSARVNSLYLQGRSRAPVTWGREIVHKRARAFRLGCFDPVSGVITISRRLDHRDIPAYVVEYVIFHEMLHEVLGIGERPDGRRDIHGRTFKLMEQTYPFYLQAREFEKKKWCGG